MSKVPVVFIVDDDIAFAEAVSALIGSMGFTSKRFASSVEFVNRFDIEIPGVILLNEQMQGTSSLSLLEHLNRAPLRPAVVFLSSQPNIRTALQAMRQGAVDYLEKGCDTTELYEAIQRGMAQDAANRAAYARRQDIAKRFAELNQPEKEVLDHVLRGSVNKQIAALLGISRRTVEYRRARIVQKLGVESFAQLVALATIAGFQLEVPAASLKVS